MDQTKKEFGLNALSRRNFLLSSAAAGIGMGLSRKSLAQGAATAAGIDNDLNVAVLGVGAQGRVLLESCLRIPNLKFRAVCDIWSYHQKYGQNLLRKYGHDVNVYEDYREMLAQEKDLDAVIVATPDWMHAEHANACMEAGLHVYSEKEMSNSLEKARSMVLTSKRTGKLLQIGHQRRSNPRYRHAIDNIMHKERLLGRITQAYGQWNRAKSEDIGWPRKYEMTPEQLDKYGYKNMSEFRNWRWYKKYGGGPIVDLGSHQIDIFSWVFKTAPKSVMAGGGVDFYKQHEWYDNVMCIYEFENDEGVSRAFYQVLTTTSHGGFAEVYMGENASVELSEVPMRGNSVVPEAHSDMAQWDELARRGMLKKAVEPPKPSASKNVMLDVRVSGGATGWPLPIDLAKPAHQPHLENFFNAIRCGEELNCPGEIGYETAVMVLRVNEAVAAGRKIEFAPEEFHA